MIALCAVLALLEAARVVRSVRAARAACQNERFAIAALRAAGGSR